MHKERNIGIAIEILGNGIGVGLQMIIPSSPVLGWIIIIVSNAVGFGLIGYSIGKPEVTNKPITETMVLGKPKKRLSFYDRQAIHEVEIQMYKSHGHADTRTMESDMLNGVLASELLNRRCSICGRLRSESGE